ncbi:hypothetical protein ACN28E_24895 [Archangium lansingense]|uniref:hypothetical protein n=1 Tax=Archangium lansingense TaxID=2995310 RepID=UPI003B809265
MTTPLEMTLREVVAMAQGMVVMDGEVRLGFIASSAEAARCTGFAVAKRLTPFAVTWHPARQQVRWPSGAVMTFLSVNEDRLRGYNWAAAFLSAPANATATPGVLEQVKRIVRLPGAGVILCAEVRNRGHLEDLLQQAA